MAFFQGAMRPGRPSTRRSLLGMFAMLTFLTLTSKRVSTALRTSHLLALGWTSKKYWFRISCSCEDFSVNTGFLRM